MACKTGNLHDTIWKVCSWICLLLFTIWLVFAIFDYLDLPTTSSFSIKQGDNGDKMVQMPTFTFCKPVTEVVKNSHKLRFWNNAPGCSNSSSKIKPPYFLNYLHDCLECKFKRYDSSRIIESYLRMFF